MYLSDSDLKEFCNHGKSPEVLSTLLTERVVEVEAMHSRSEALDKVVVGIVREIKPHPQADRLRIVETDIGNQVLPIVCGGKNLYVGELVAVALAGAQVRWHGQGDKVKLEPAVIRGIKSEGMICAAAELDLPISDKGAVNSEPSYAKAPDGRQGGGRGEGVGGEEGPFILDLTRFIPQVKAGTPLAKAFGFDDVCYEIDNKSLARRADLWGYWGVARELSVLTGKPLKKPELAKVKFEKPRITEVKDKEGCWRYITLEIENVKAIESPWLIQRKLINAGVRPINLIVDLTNLVMFELGQPLHAIDVRGIDKMTVRRAKNGENFLALNEKEYTLDNRDCIVESNGMMIDIGGIMGGAQAEIKPDTTKMYLEVATFDPIMIRKTSQRLLLRSDASARFEKGQAVELAEMAACRFVWYLKKYLPEAKVIHAEQFGNIKTKTVGVKVDWDKMDSLIGEGVVSKKQAQKYLSGLGMKVAGSTVTPPWWRNDIAITEDVAEEVSRLFGFNNFKHLLPQQNIEPAVDERERVLVEKVRDWLVREAKFTETESYPFAVGSKGSRIKVVSPIAQNCDELRDDLLLTVVSGLAKNQRFFNDVRMFELGRVFLSGVPSNFVVKTRGKNYLPSQPFYCAAAVYGEGYSLLTVKGIVEQMFVGLGFKVNFLSAPRIGLKPEFSLGVQVNDQLIGYVGIIDLEYLKITDAKGEVYAFDLDLEKLANCPLSDKHYEKVSEYPAVLRDVAMVVDNQVTYLQVSAIFDQFIGKLLKSYQLFDVYSGPELGVGKKSLALHLMYQLVERTLTGEEVEKEHAQIIEALKNELGAEIRK